MSSNTVVVLGKSARKLQTEDLFCFVFLLCFMNAGPKIFFFLHGILSVIRSCDEKV